MLSNTTFDDSTSQAFTEAFDASAYDKILLFLKLSKSGSPTDLNFTLQISHDRGSNWHDMDNGFLSPETIAEGDISGTTRLGLSGEVPGELVRIKVDANGVDASNTFDVRLDGIQYTD